MENNFKLTDQQFPLPYNAYAAFDAISLKQLMLERLNENSVFTDQIYEGSNFNNFIDVIAYSYHVLLYYLNKTSNESLFATSQIYENMNKIVRLLNYNPIGYQSSVLKFEATANSNLSPNIYTIPRYSFFNINDVSFSFTQDTTFIKTTTGSEILERLNEESFLVQGKFVEYPLYTATGEPFEQITITSVDTQGNNTKIDHNSIDVYVRNENGEWEQWKRVDSLFLCACTEKSFECRLNENQRYVIRFGNNINGRQLRLGNVVGIYYLESSLDKGQVGPRTLNGNKLFFFRTPNLDIISSQVRDPNVNLINFEQASNINFRNNTASSTYGEIETTDQIRQNAPNLFKAQGRLVTTGDFEAFIRANFSNIVHDVKVVNNWEYLDGHVKYLYNIGLQTPSQDSRVLYNQVKYADSCNFNDVYIYVVPKIFTTNSTTKFSSYLNPTAKLNIINKTNSLKLATVEPIIMDPVYVAISIGAGKSFNPQDDSIDRVLNESKLIIQKTSNIFTSDISIKDKVLRVFQNYFTPDKCTLGMYVDIDKISQEILDIPGVGSIYTTRKGQDVDTTVSDISLVMFNPVYKEITEDVRFTAQNQQLPYFKIPFIYSMEQLEKSIVVVAPAYIDSGTQEY